MTESVKGPVPDNRNMMLCNIEDGKGQMQVRYIVEDFEFFILIDPDFSIVDKKIAVVDRMTKLRHIDI